MAEDARAEVTRFDAELSAILATHHHADHVGGSLGGDFARRIQYWPVSGRARQHLLEGEKSVFAQERRPVRAPKADDGDLELFG